MERYKVWLVAKGYNQVEGVDYQETFALVAKMVIVRILLSVAALCGWHLHQLDDFASWLREKKGDKRLQTS